VTGMVKLTVTVTDDYPEGEKNQFKGVIAQ